MLAKGPAKSYSVGPYVVQQLTLPSVRSPQNSFSLRSISENGPESVGTAYTEPQHSTLPSARSPHDPYSQPSTCRKTPVGGITTIPVLEEARQSGVPSELSQQPELA